MQIKPDVFGRMEQTFYFIKNNIKLVVGYLVFNLCIYVISMAVFNYWINHFVMITSFYSEKTNLLIFIEFIVYILSMILIGIGIKIGIINYIKEGFYEKEPNVMQSFQYGMNKIFNSFVTYFYVFVYVFLIPLSITIVGLVLLLIEQMGKGNTGTIGGVLLISSFVLLIAFIIYRGNRSIFAIYSAVDKDNYDKENFDSAVEITKDNVLRIIGNMLLVSLIIGLMAGLINQVGSAFDTGYDSLAKIDTNNMTAENFRLLFDLIFKVRASGIISTITGAVIFVFNLTYLYLFYKRLEYESGNVINLDSNNIISDIKNNDL